MTWPSRDPDRDPPGTEAVGTPPPEPPRPDDAAWSRSPEPPAPEEVVWSRPPEPPTTPAESEWSRAAGTYPVEPPPPTSMRAPEGQPGAGWSHPSAPGQQAYPGSTQPYPGYPVPRGGGRPTNSLAIAALVCSLAGLVTGISAPVGAVLGHLASRQIAQTGEDGESLAKAAIWVGWIITGLAVAACCGALAIGIAVSRSTAFP